MSRNAKSSQESKQEKNAQKAKHVEPEIGTVVKTGYVIGRNKVVIDPNDVFELAKAHCTIGDMANFFGVPRDTLQYNFGDLIIQGYEYTKQSLRKKQLEVAFSGNPTMLIWLGKQMLGQTDVPTPDGIGEGDTIIEVKVTRPTKPNHPEVKEQEDVSPK